MCLGLGMVPITKAHSPLARISQIAPANCKGARKGHSSRCSERQGNMVFLCQVSGTQTLRRFYLLSSLESAHKIPVQE
jgi:hypothetical protein